MAKGRVTENSLRVGQTVYGIYGSPFKTPWVLLKTNIKENEDKNYVHFNVSHIKNFYSKSKAKTKIKKLNEGF